MKKLYTLALAVAAALTANAQVYFVGEFDGVQQWTPDAPREATKNAEGNWEIVLPKTGGFKMSKAMGTWDEFDAAAFSVNNGSVSEDLIGSWQPAVAWGQNTNMPAQAEWKVEVTADYSQVRFTMEGEAAAVEAYITGEFAGWGFEEAWKMTNVSEGLYTFSCAGDKMLGAGVEFKIAAPGWTMINYTIGGKIESSVYGLPNEVEYNPQGVGNMFFVEDFTGTIELELLEGYNGPAVLTFTAGNAGVEDVTVADNAKPVYYNLQGVEVAKPANGLYIVRRGNEVSKVLVK